MSIRRTIGSAFADRAGVAALEFTIMMPLLLIMALGIYDVGRAMHDTMRLETAARAGVEYALRAPSDTAGIKTAALATLEALPNAVIDDPTITCLCPGATEGACATACTGMKRYVRLVVRANMSGLLFKHVVTLRGDATGRLI